VPAYKLSHQGIIIMEQEFKKFFLDELRDIYSAEMQIIQGLPKMIAAAESPELIEAFTTHLEETKNQAERLRNIFSMLNEQAKEKRCMAMEGLISEAAEAIGSMKKSFVLDAALITKAQRIEHYEIATYGALRTFADQLDLPEISTILQKNLDEEGATDKKLTKIAKGSFFATGINQKAIS
jgi:ferritin-like metal-binding protein YciE